MSYNRVIMQGNLTRDPEIRNAGTTTVCTFGLATTHKYKGRDGATKEDKCFVDCKLFGKSGDMFAEWFRKGSPVLLEGRLCLEQWDDKTTGQKRSKHTIFVEQFTFVGERKKAEATAPASGYVSPDDSIPF